MLLEGDSNVANSCSVIEKIHVFFEIYNFFANFHVFSVIFLNGGSGKNDINQTSHPTSPTNCQKERQFFVFLYVFCVS